MDDDGNPTVNGDPANIVPSWIIKGACVSIATTKGRLTDLRVTGEPYVDEYGRMVVPVCVEEEWQKAKTSSRVPKAYPYPVSSVYQA